MPGLIRGVARTAVVAGTATAVSGRVSRRQQGRWAAKEKRPPQPKPLPRPPSTRRRRRAAPSTDDKLAQLKQLGELRDAGVLTDAEFEAQKGKILYAS